MRIPLFIFISLFCSSLFASQDDSLEKGVSNTASETTKQYSNDDALAISQAAIGKTTGHYRFTLPSGEVITSQKFLGKPLIISLIYTSCYHICPTTTQNLNRVVQKARDVLGEESFNVLTIGFDTHKDTPEAMAHFSELHTNVADNWFFLSTDSATMKALTRDLGFIFKPTPHGFDHLIQASILDKDGVVYRQVYGMRPKTPHFVEPIKELVFGEPEDDSLFSEFTSKVKLFCTIYDPTQDRYYFNYSVFAGVIVGMILGGFFIWIFIREWRYSNKSRELNDTNQ